MSAAKNRAACRSYPLGSTIDAARKAEMAANLRAIVELLADAPGTICDISMCCHLGDDLARRYIKILQKAGIVEWEQVLRIVHGKRKLVPIQLWYLSRAYKAGEVTLDALLRRLGA